MHYNTSIKRIISAKQDYVQRHGQEPLFLSDWDAAFEMVHMPNFDYTVSLADKQKYYYWTDEGGFRNSFCEFYQHSFKQEICTNSFVICSNGTSSIMLSAMALRELGVSKIMVCTPSYFSTLNILEKLDYSISEYPLDFKTEFQIDTQDLEKQIILNQVQALFLTSPIFGSGVEIPPETLSEISRICNQHGIWLIFDYVYGGMIWSDMRDEDYIFNHKVYTAIASTEKHIFIESISKRIFLNGVKIALTFSSPEIIRRILRLSIYTVGSMCYAQLDAFRKLYSIDNTIYIAQNIRETIKTAKQHFARISPMLLDKDVLISPCNSCYFALLSIPKPLRSDDLDYSIYLLDQSGVLTVPHSRYRLMSEDRYCFRVNLLINWDTIAGSIIRLRDLL